VKKIFFKFDPKKEVVQPFIVGYKVEAFARLDSYLDAWIEVLCRKHFGEDSRLLSLIDELNLVPPFQKARLLEKQGVLSPALYSRLKRFKEARNRLAHSLAPLAEHGLRLPAAQGKPLEEAEKLAEKDLEKALQEGLALYAELAVLAQK
jgi:hypothetical protein